MLPHLHMNNPTMSHENYDPLFPDQPVVDLYLPIWASLPSFRSKPAFIWAEDGAMGSTRGSSHQLLTYEQLNNSAQLISCQLLPQLKRGDTVLILCSPGLELVELIFGCQRAGLLIIPLLPPDPSFAKDDHHHLIRVLSQTNPKAVISNNAYITSVQRYISSENSRNKQLCELLKKLTWILSEDIIGDKKVDLQRIFSSYNGCKPDEVYLTQYTSGATGVPKPVLVTAGSAAHNVRAARKAYDLCPESVIVSWLPQYHDCGLMFLLLNIVSGATCVLTSPQAFIKRPRLWLELITEFKATCTPVPSFALPLVVKRGGINKGAHPFKLYSMKNLVIINEPIYKESVEEFVEAFRPYGLNPMAISPSYGLAENCTFVSTAWRSENNSNFLPSFKKLLPVARLGSGTRNEEDEINVVVVNEDTHDLVKDGFEGEIWVSSPSNASGYLNLPTLTREVFQGRLTNKLSKCFVRTGDTGIIKGEERYLYVTGRTLDIIKLQTGHEIHPHYIETAAYNSCPKFLRGGCIAAFKLERKVTIVAEMQRNEGEIMVLRNICEGIREAVLKENRIKVGMVVLVMGGSVPKTTSGKIRRSAARSKLLGGKMKVKMQMNFEGSPETMGTLNQESGGKEGSKIVDEGSRVFVSLPINASIHLPRPSSL